jgi:hypothetical protein
MQATRGRGIVTTLFDLSTRRGKRQRHSPAALYLQEKDPPVPIVQEAGWAPELVWTQRLEESPVVESVLRHYSRHLIKQVYLCTYIRVLNVTLRQYGGGDDDDDDNDSFMYSA